jgi:rare lipoprotein A
MSPPLEEPVAKGLYKVGKPYQVKGEWYYPRADYTYDQTGIASWYGPGFHSRMTANGETYDQTALTAAHTSLPMPSLVRVTNLENGRQVVVRINDRGPFVSGRIIDMTQRGAQLLGFDRQGTAKVRVQILADESRAIALAAQRRDPSAFQDGRQVASLTPEDGPLPAAAPTGHVSAQPLQPANGRPASAAARRRMIQPPAAKPGVLAEPIETARDEKVTTVPGTVEDGLFLPAPEVRRVPVRSQPQIFVQAGSFTRFDNANRLRARLSVVGPTNVSPVMVGATQFFRVRLGPFAQLADADQALAHVIGAGQQDARIVVD